jgi:gliding-associated putative ABC transporter substrate-binding component GldG
VQDRKCYSTEYVVEQNNRPVVQYGNWMYFPVVDRAGMANHPVNQNLDGVCLRYASALDTVRAPGIARTVLLSSSHDQSRALNSPVIISFRNLLRGVPPPQIFRNRGDQVLALLAEGTFPSAFEGRTLPPDSTGAAGTPPRFLPRTAQPNKLIVVGDGDLLLRDHLRGRPNMPFDNLPFLLNAVDYLINDSTYREVRAKTVLARNLDPITVRRSGDTVALLNVAVPVVFLAVFGTVRWWWRRRKNQRLAV